MEEYARGRTSRSIPRPLCVEPLEDRFLLSAVTPLPPDHSGDPAVAGQGGAADPGTPTPAVLANGAAGAPPSSPDDGASPRSTPEAQNVPPSLVRPATKYVAVAQSLSSPLPAPYAGSPADSGRHDDDDPTTEGYERQQRFDAREAMDFGFVCPGGQAGESGCDKATAPGPGSVAPSLLHGQALPALDAVARGAMGVGAEKAGLSHPPQPTAPEVTPAVPLSIPAARSPAARVALADARLEASSRLPEVDHVADLMPAAAGPLAGLVPFDLARLEQDADTFFARLAALGEDWTLPQAAARAAPWLAAVTAVALELARARKQPTPLVAAGRLPGLPGLGAGDET